MVKDGGAKVILIIITGVVNVMSHVYRITNIHMSVPDGNGGLALL